MYKSLNIVCVLLLVFSQQLMSQNIDVHKIPMELKISESSSLKLAGKTNVNKFECNYEGKFYKQDKIKFKKQRTYNIVEFEEFQLEIEVEQLDCHKRVYNKTMLNLLEVSEHPEIIIKVHKITFLSDFQENGVMAYFNGLVTIAGVEKETIINLYKAEKTENGLSFIGDVNLLMTQFQIEPPTKMGGAIKVMEELLVSVNLVFIQ